MEGSMPRNAIAAHTWSRELDAERPSSSLETVSLFSLAGLAVSAVVLLTSSAQTVAAITAALI
jgi:hypothetical protein